jgi:S1-C subfamily serine protease
MKFLTLKRSAIGGIFIFLFIVLVVNYFNLTAQTENQSQIKNRLQSLNNQIIATNLTSNEQNNIDIFKQTNKSVVYVTNSQVKQDAFSLNIQEIPAGTGTGLIWDKTGLIITNFHVVKNASKVIITLWDQSTWEATAVGIAPDKDLAVLKINAPTEKLLPISIGDSSLLEVGRKVLAIGNPFGLDTTLTVGVVSALGREINLSGRKIKGLIQTDAAINPGNSGGPLLDSKGKLIGINTLIYSPSGASSGVGFAIPINSVIKTVPQLIKYGKIMRPVIGIQMVSDNIAVQFGVKGVIVHKVVPGSPADKVGLSGISSDLNNNILLGDVIIKLGKFVIDNSDDLLTALESFQANDSVKLVTMRNEKVKEFKIQLAKSD